MQRPPRFARALAATLFAASGCTAVTDVDRFQGALEDESPYASLHFSVVDMQSHVKSYFELRMIDGNNKTQFIAIADPFSDDPQATFNIPHVAFKRKLATYRLDFFGDMNGNKKYNFGNVYDDAGAITDLGDHSWRLKSLDKDNNQVTRRKGLISELEIRYIHQSMYDELVPALVQAEQGQPITIDLAGLENYQNRLLQLRVGTSGGEGHTIGLFRASRVKEPTLKVVLPDVLYEFQPYEIEVYVDANNNGRYDNPAEGEGDLGWRFDVDASQGSLNASFDLSKEQRSNVDVGEP
jgi:hypothetical protein